MAGQKTKEFFLDMTIPDDIQRKLKKPMKPIELSKMDDVIELRKQRKLKKESNLISGRKSVIKNLLLRYESYSEKAALTSKTRFHMLQYLVQK
jgi:hypothetical protein